MDQEVIKWSLNALDVIKIVSNVLVVELISVKAARRDNT